MFDRQQILEQEWIEEPVEQLNLEQLEAVEAILEWMEGEESYFLLNGSAGTGKTYSIKSLIDKINGKVVFTAPTNKATKVLRETLTTEEYSPICRTIYSLLGLKLEANGAIKTLTSPEDPVDLSSIKLIIIDEWSMVNSALVEKIKEAVENYKVKVLFLGDKNQLPPVNEKESKVWELADKSVTLYQVMRFDNQILPLAEKIKGQVNHPAPSIKLESSNDGLEGVWMLDRADFLSRIMKAAREGDFSNPTRLVKAIAWRNVVVGSLNRTIRKQIFDNADENVWLPGDRIILTSPAADLTGRGIGCTDDEGTVERISIEPHPLYQDFHCYNLSVLTDENKRISLLVLHKDSEFDFRFRQNYLANEAKLQPRKWKDYWNFTDAFHKVQHGYAITAHRAQGSTYDSCYVVWNDILLNRNRNEAYRCLYVACTRPKRKLILGRL